MADLAERLGALLRRRSTDPGVRALAVNTAFSFVPPRGGAEIAVLEGLVLVTQAGDPADHVLGRGEALRLPGRGRIAAMALSDARVRLRSLPAAGVAQSPAWNGATCGTSSS